MSQREAYYPPQRSPSSPFRSSESTASTSTTTATTPTYSSINTPNGAGNDASSAGNTTIDQASAQIYMQQPPPGRRATGFRRPFDTADRKMRYICGDCGKSEGYKADDPLRCSGCGCRTLYKPRIKQYVAPGRGWFLRDECSQKLTRVLRILQFKTD